VGKKAAGISRITIRISLMDKGSAITHQKSRRKLGKKMNGDAGIPHLPKYRIVQPKHQAA